MSSHFGQTPHHFKCPKKTLEAFKEEKSAVSAMISGISMAFSNAISHEFAQRTPKCHSCNRQHLSQ
eukprot:scaffold29637_cov58-Skeletonema_marinoi.AAC.1